VALVMRHALVKPASSADADSEQTGEDVEAAGEPVTEQTAQAEPGTDGAQDVDEVDESESGT
jgi:hypothetical protein